MHLWTSGNGYLRLWELSFYQQMCSSCCREAGEDKLNHWINVSLPDHWWGSQGIWKRLGQDWQMPVWTLEVFLGGGRGPHRHEDGTQLHAVHQRACCIPSASSRQWEVLGLVLQNKCRHALSNYLAQSLVGVCSSHPLFLSPPSFCCSLSLSLFLSLLSFALYLYLLFLPSLSISTFCSCLLSLSLFFFFSVFLLLTFYTSWPLSLSLSMFLVLSLSFFIFDTLSRSIFSFSLSFICISYMCVSFASVSLSPYLCHCIYTYISGIRPSHGQHKCHFRSFIATNGQKHVHPNWVHVLLPSESS